jgi:indole-3-glycerol phosphate synthase
MMLDEIIRAKKEEVVHLKAQKPLACIRESVPAATPARDFKSALQGKACSIIAEIKRRSPSKGFLRGDMDAVHMAEIYEKNGAAAISVLTDRPFFSGRIEDLEEVSRRVAIPVLRKDFIVDPYQIYEARAAGADAILLIAAVLDDDQLADYSALARSLTMASLVEVHTRPELERALEAGAEIVGINNRDLQTFKTDIDVSLKMAALVPEGRVVVSESGIHGRSDIEKLMGAGIHAFLVGEVLVTAPDAGIKLKELAGR